MTEISAEEKSIWQLMEEKRKNYQEWIKNRIAAKKVLYDHVQAVNGEIKKPVEKKQLNSKIKTDCEEDKPLKKQKLIQFEDEAMSEKEAYYQILSLLLLTKT